MYANDIAFEIAKKSEIAENFRDIRVINFYADYGVYKAFTDSKNEILFLNSENDYNEILPLVIHEVGHIDRRLKSPKTLENFYKNTIKKNKKLAEILNFVFDMNIHRVYANNLPLSYKIILHDFLTRMRNRILKEDSKNLILSLVYPKTLLQKKVKKILENDKLKDIEKAKKILDLFKDKGKRKVKKRIGKRKKLTQYDISDIRKLTNTNTKVIFEKDDTIELKKISKSIKRKIKEYTEQVNDLREKLAQMGYSAQQTDIMIEEIKSDDIEYVIQNLDAIKNIFVLSEKSYVNIREKKKKKEKEIGKLIGYRRIKSFDDLIKNPTDLLLFSDYDINGLRIPKFIEDKSKTTNVFIIRDVSGSLSSKPLNDYIRDSIIGVLNLAKRFNYKVCLIEFSDKSKVIKGSDGKELTTDYKTLMLKSLFNKYGSSTCLSVAIKDINRIIEENKLYNDNVNVVLITDSYTDDAEKIKVRDDKLRLIVLTTDDDYSNDFSKFIKKHLNKKIFHLKKVENGKSLILDVIEKTFE